MTDTDRGRRAAHVFLDTASVWTPDTTEAEQERVLQLAMDELATTGSVTATFDDETEEAHVDVSALVGGLMVLVSALVERVALESGLSRLDVVAQTREVIDASL